MKDVLEVDPNLGCALPLDPFGSKPQWASKIAGLGGGEPPPDPAYAFLTLDSRPAIGTITVQLRFFDLVATHGTLLIELNVRSAFPGADPSRLQTIAVDLRELSQSGSIVEFSFESYRNVYYSIGGSINDETDAAASLIAITIDKRADAEQHGTQWGWRAGNRLSARRRTDIVSALVDRVLTDLKPPQLDHPVSQVGSPLQCRETSFLATMAQLRRTPDPTFENWAMAYVMQAITRFAGADGPTKMLGYFTGEAPLLSYFAAQKHEIVAMHHSTDAKEGPDPGSELQKLWVPEICREEDYFAHAYFTTGDIRLPKESMYGQFDIIWSIGANRFMTPNEFVNFAIHGLILAKPGGLAVHVFDYADETIKGNQHIIYRQEIERLAALALSHYNDVARLRFRHGAPSDVSTGILPFGMILLRGEMPDT